MYEGFVTLEDKASFKRTEFVKLSMTETDMTYNLNKLSESKKSIVWMETKNLLWWRSPEWQQRIQIKQCWRDGAGAGPRAGRWDDAASNNIRPLKDGEPLIQRNGSTRPDKAFSQFLYTSSNGFKFVRKHRTYWLWSLRELPKTFSEDSF